MNRTKVVIRHLPPTLTQSAFFDQIDARFSGCYNWSTFRPGKSRFEFPFRAFLSFDKSVIYGFDMIASIPFPLLFMLVFLWVFIILIVYGVLLVCESLFGTFVPILLPMT